MILGLTAPKAQAFRAFLLERSAKQGCIKKAINMLALKTPYLKVIMAYLRQDLMDNIIEKLTFVKAKVEVSNPLNLTDVNIISENFYRDLLNLVFGYRLKNINKIVQNAASIDLGDEDNKICFQVTSTSTLTKSKKTVDGFIAKNYHEKYDRLVILNIVSKSKHQDPKIGDAAKYELNTKDDIWDVSSLLKEIGDKDDIDEIQAISDFLDKEIKFEAKHSLAKEIVTFMSLITYLSDEAQPAAGTGYMDKPDPDGKIYKRFSDHAGFLTKEYQDLYTEYGLVLKDVLQQADMGQARIRRLAMHLKNESDKVLTDTNDDPKKALNVLMVKYEDVLKQKGSLFDLTAIRFFLLDQLIACNVFPNKVNA
jgi:hypothetical protein